MTDPSPRSDDPDVAIMLRLQAGDTLAFEELVRRHQKNVLNLVFRYLGDASFAEDVAQEVFLKVYRARAGYEPKAKFSTWLYRVTVNHCLNEIRSRKSQPARMELVDDLLEESSVLEAGERLRKAEIQQAVKAAIDSLPEHQRMAVILARYEELSYEEIAATMGISLEAVKSVLHRAKDGLKEKLAKHVQR